MASPPSARANIRIDDQQVNVQVVREPLNDDMRLELVQIPEGDFMMGSSEDEEGRWSDGREGPQHSVHVPEFWMGRYPVTQAEWRIVAGFEKIEHDLKPDPSNFKGDRHPVEWVSWYEAVEFCNRLSTYTGRNYRLPSEAEWEYACRATTTTPFYFGDTITTDLANYRGTDDESSGLSGSYGNGPKGESRRKTIPVDQFDAANLFGLSDMHGNTWEWCLDHWHGNYKDAPDDGSAWLNIPQSNSRRVLRGGSWSYNPSYCRSASRYFNNPNDRYYNIGFRLILAPRSALLP